MSEKMVIYAQREINRETGEITDMYPVELTEEQFADWIQPAIPHLVETFLGVRAKRETKIEKRRRKA